MYLRKEMRKMCLRESDRHQVELTEMKVIFYIVISFRLDKSCLFKLQFDESSSAYKSAESSKAVNFDESEEGQGRTD